MEASMKSNEEKGAEKLMDDYLKSIGLHRKKIAKDGSCLFRAVAEQVLHCQSLHTKVRAKCVEFLKENRESYEAFIEGDFEEYLSKLQDPQQWVGEVEINALAVMYKRDFLIFQEPGKQAVNITDNNFKDKVRLCFLNGNHYDSVYPIKQIKDSALCQSILYELLYEDVFNVDRNSMGSCNRGGRPSDILSDDIIKLCASSDESEPDTGEGLWVENGTSTTAPRHRGRGRGRHQLPERVRRSLNPTLFRNVEYDIWHKTKRGGRSYNATIKEVPPNNDKVTVHIEELGLRKQVPLMSLRPFEESSWSTVATVDESKAARKSVSSLEAAFGLTETQRLAREEEERNVALVEIQLRDEHSFPALGAQVGASADGGKKKGVERKRYQRNNTKSPVEDPGSAPSRSSPEPRLLSPKTSLLSPKLRLLLSPKPRLLLSPKLRLLLSPKPRLLSPKPRLLSPKPRLLSPKPRLLSPKPKLLSPKLRLLSPKLLSPKLRLLSPKLRLLLSPKLRLLSPKLRLLSPEPRLLPSPKPSSISPKTSLLSQKLLSPKPSSISPKPSSISPKPKLLSQKRISPKPSSISPTPSLISPSPLSLPLSPTPHFLSLPLSPILTPLSLSLPPRIHPIPLTFLTLFLTPSFTLFLLSLTQSLFLTLLPPPITPSLTLTLTPLLLLPFLTQIFLTLPPKLTLLLPLLTPFLTPPSTPSLHLLSPSPSLTQSLFLILSLTLLPPRITPSLTQTLTLLSLPPKLPLKLTLRLPLLTPFLPPPITPSLTQTLTPFLTLNLLSFPPSLTPLPLLTPPKSPSHIVSHPSSQTPPPHPHLPPPSSQSHPDSSLPPPPHPFQYSHIYEDPLYPGFPEGETGDPAPTPPLSSSRTGEDLPKDVNILKFFFNLGIKNASYRGQGYPQPYPPYPPSSHQTPPSEELQGVTEQRQPTNGDKIQGQGPCRVPAPLEGPAAANVANANPNIQVVVSGYGHKKDRGDSLQRAVLLVDPPLNNNPIMALLSNPDGSRNPGSPSHFDISKTTVTRDNGNTPRSYHGNRKWPYGVMGSGGRPTTAAMAESLSVGCSTEDQWEDAAFKPQTLNHRGRGRSWRGGRGSEKMIFLILLLLFLTSCVYG
ncbi:OTU domain containing protein 4 [Dissostichus eleginoides]|uniref:ubiquitinyl hydrolase 1 n=1 Tax=Dissostichus eleginoides TaxID=100907 RepID=A0AAD9F8T9_DISEL|nr:OTU domain containing protein 4 [Dissostichus eleginoides]